MSLFGAMNTAISGLGAQSNAFTNISNNVANSQTTGYKGVDTHFADLVNSSTATANGSGSVKTTPGYTNEVQGSIQQSTDPTALAISGQGFFAVSQQNGESNTGTPTFGNLTEYTRNGDFQLNKDGYLVNSASEFLNGWSIDGATGAVNQGVLAPIQVTSTQYNPVPSSKLTLAANLPPMAPGTTAAQAGSLTSSYESQVQVYDSQGAAHTLQVKWQPAYNDGQVSGTGSYASASGAGTVVSNSWVAIISSPDNYNAGTSQAPIGEVQVNFNAQGELVNATQLDAAATASSVGSGTVGTGGVQDGSGVYVTPALTGTPTQGTSLDVSFNADFGSGVAQGMTLNLGTIGQSVGMTQFAGTAYSLRGFSQDGLPSGAFTGITVLSNGNVQANYNNGQSKTVAQVPIVTFANAAALQSQDGQAYTATSESGNPIAQTQGTNGAGALVVGSVENSNVDIATELSKLIVAQQAYGANAKMITAANQLLQTTIDMKQ